MSSHPLAQLQPGHPRRAGAQSREAARRALERSLLYSEELGIDLAERSDPMYFRWFLASLLFGARISETIAKNTYRSFFKHGLTSPTRVLDAGWDFLVYPVMREGGYVRRSGEACELRGFRHAAAAPFRTHEPLSGAARLRRRYGAL